LKGNEENIGGKKVYLRRDENNISDKKKREILGTVGEKNSCRRKLI